MDISDSLNAVNEAQNAMVRGRRESVWRVIVPPVLFTAAIGAAFTPEVFHVDHTPVLTAVGVVAAIGMFACFAVPSWLNAKRTGVAMLPNRDISARSRNRLMMLDVALGAVCAVFFAAFGMTGFLVAMAGFAWIRGGARAWMQRA
ncbi:hypothetical protein [Streptomyces sp. NPDC002550]